jgi:pimeloyl-ACP methyl ester carboxylesterase
METTRRKPRSGRAGALRLAGPEARRALIDTMPVTERRIDLDGIPRMPAIPEAELSAITVPTFLIWGRHDLATPLTVARAASAHHGWQLGVVESAADDPPIEQPAAFLAALRRALGDAG